MHMLSKPCIQESLIRLLRKKNISSDNLTSAVIQSLYSHIFELTDKDKKTDWYAKLEESFVEHLKIMQSFTS